MVSSPPGATRFSVGLVARAAAIAVLTYFALQLAVGGRLYATALVVASFAALLFLSLWRAITRADRMLARFVDGVIMGDLERSTATASAGFSRFAQAIELAADKLRRERGERQQRIELLLALLDGVPAALLVLEGSGRVTLANRAARALAREEVSRLDDIGALAGAARRLELLAPGGREIVRLADGRVALASCLGFSTPGAEAQRLICLQDVAQLDAVEIKAWQDLVRVLAHEMLNSLTPIVSLAESLQHGRRRKAEVAEAIEVIGRRSSGLMSFVDRYRKVAEAPRPNVRPIAVGSFMDGLDRLLGPMLAGAGLTYERRIEPATLVIHADQDLLEQAMINLIKNAVDAVSGVASPVILVACRNADDRVEIIVRDNGPGLPAEEIERVFVPFFTTKAGGSGIGLSVARQIALAHHGRLDAGPAPGGGAEFRLTLPNPQVSNLRPAGRFALET